MIRGLIPSTSSEASSADDQQKVVSVLATLAAQGNVRTETTQAFVDEEFEGIVDVQDLGRSGPPEAAVRVRVSLLGDGFNRNGKR